MVQREVQVYLDTLGIPQRIPVSQFDTGWQFLFKIFLEGQRWEIPAGATAVLNGRKPDGNVFAFEGTINDNEVIVNCDVQMTAVSGNTVCELSILSDGKVIGSRNFVLEVEVAPKSPDDVSSESTLPAYGEILDRIAEMGGGGGGTITVDDALSATSENPVQNKVVKAALANKVDKVSGKGLSTNDYTTAEKNKLAGVEAGAQVNPKLFVNGEQKNIGVFAKDSTVGISGVWLYAGVGDEIEIFFPDIEGFNTGVQNILSQVHSIPAGGTAGQFLVKQSATDYDAAWVTVPNASGVSF